MDRRKIMMGRCERYAWMDGFVHCRDCCNRACCPVADGGEIMVQVCDYYAPTPDALLRLLARVSVGEIDREKLEDWEREYV